ncbi:neuronal acetylcholine receptor subunit alpha-6-like [Glandiceps talaboti]
MLEKLQMLKMWITFLLLSTCLIISRNFVGVNGSDAEKRLFRYLFDDNTYQKEVRPVENVTDTLHLDFALVVLQILDVDEKQQTLKLASWAEHVWVDIYLRWDPANFSGIESIVAPYTKVWKPDIILDNSISGSYRIPTLDTVTIEYDGTVYYTPPAVFKTPCTMNIRYFPFDIQRCKLNFGPWELTTDKLLMHAIYDDVKQEKYTDNTEWRFLNSSVGVEGEEFSSYPDEEYSLLVYTLVLKRRPLYYLINILLPCLILAVLTLMVLSLPPESGEKMSFGVSLLIALSVFNLMVAEIIPPSSDSVPMLVQFLIFNLALVQSSIIVSVVVLRLHHRQPYHLKMSSCIRVLFMKILPKLLFMFPFKGQQAVPSNKVETVVSESHINKAFEPINGLRRSTRELANGHGVRSASGRMQNVDASYNARTLRSIENILEELRHLRKNVDSKEEEEFMLAQWHYVAKVVDRLSMHLAIIAYVIGGVFLYTDPELRFDL